MWKRAKWSKVKWGYQLQTSSAKQFRVGELKEMVKRIFTYRQKEMEASQTRTILKFNLTSRRLQKKLWTLNLNASHKSNYFHKLKCRALVITSKWLKGKKKKIVLSYCNIMKKYNFKQKRKMIIQLTNLIFKWEKLFKNYCNIYASLILWQKITILLNMIKLKQKKKKNLSKFLIWNWSN